MQYRYDDDDETENKKLIPWNRGPFPLPRFCFVRKSNPNSGERTQQKAVEKKREGNSYVLDNSEIIKKKNH